VASQQRAAQVRLLTHLVYGDPAGEPAPTAEHGQDLGERTETGEGADLDGIAGIAE
jgi:hypothetical protein